MILIRPVRSQYINKSGYGRWLKPDIRHGAWFIKGSRESLAYIRKYTDQIVKESELPEKLVHRIANHPRGEIYLSPQDMRAHDYPVPEVPETGWQRSWFYFTHDDGGMS